MSKSLVPERGARKTAATEQPKLARGTRDISPATLNVARGTRDMTPFVLEADDDTIVIDTDPNLAEELVLDAEAAVVGDAAEVGEASEVTESQAAAIDARMIELGQRRFGISAFRPGQALA